MPYGPSGTHHPGTGPGRRALLRRARAEGVPRRYWAAEPVSAEFAEHIASFAGNGSAGLYIHGGVNAGKTHAISAMARLFAEAGYEVAFTTAKGMLGLSVLATGCSILDLLSIRMYLYCQ